MDVEMEVDEPEPPLLQVPPPPPPMKEPTGVRQSYLKLLPTVLVPFHQPTWYLHPRRHPLMSLFKYQILDED